MYDQALETQFFSRFPKEFVGDLIRLIAEQCKSSTAECATFYEREEAMDLLGSLRRAKIEGKSRNLAMKYPSVRAVTRSSRQNGTGNYHTEFSSGDSRLTVHKVQFVGTPVRKAVYRKSLAERCDYSMFDVPKNNVPPDDAILYALLKYGVAQRMPQALAFAVVDFPDKEGKIVHRINLLSYPEFANIPAEFVSVATPEHIEDNLNMALRPDAKSNARKNGLTASMPTSNN